MEKHDISLCWYGRNLRTIRKQSGLSVEDLAKKISFDVKTVHAWEEDKCMPELETFVRLCNLFSTPPSSFLARADKK